jgi:hypothetical protein
MGILHLHDQVITTRADAICTGPITNEEKKSRDKQEDIKK